MLETLRSGDWVTRERVRFAAAGLLIAFAAALIYLVATANGPTDALGRPLGTDFSNVYAAGTLVHDGEPLVPFDPAGNMPASRRSSVLQRHSMAGTIRRSSCSSRQCWRRCPTSSRSRCGRARPSCFTSWRCA
jgi:hypothetical protein